MLFNTCFKAARESTVLLPAMTEGVTTAGLVVAMAEDVVTAGLGPGIGFKSTDFMSASDVSSDIRP